MPMTLHEGLGYAAAFGVPAAALPLRAWVARGHGGPWGLVETLLAPPHLAALAGIAIGWGVPPWLRQDLASVPSVGFVFLGGWLGLAVGSSLDLRVSRKMRLPSMIQELVQVVVALVVVAMLAWAARFLPLSLPRLATILVLLVAAVCVTGPALPPRLRQRGGAGAGFWEPSLMTAWAVLLCAVAMVLGVGPQINFYLPRVLDAPLPVELGGAPWRMVWATAAGAVTGLLADLSSREELVQGRLYVQLAAVILVAAGLAATMGMSPVWVCGVGGFWLINATLRRMDLLQVIERGMALPKLAAPSLAGWCIGVALNEGTLNLAIVVGVSLVLLIVRPAVRIGVAAQLRRRQHRRRGRRPQTFDPNLISLDEVALILVGVTGPVLGKGLHADTLLAVLAARGGLSVGAQLWRQHSDKAS